MLIIIIDRLFFVYTMMLFIRVLGSWVPEFQQYRVMQFINYYTDPYLNFFRRFIPPLGMMDFSPVFAFLSLGVINSFVNQLIIKLFY